MPSPTIEFARAQQLECADYLIEHGHDAGAALGLFDWFTEELLIEAGSE